MDLLSFISREKFLNRALCSSCVRRFASPNKRKISPAQRHSISTQRRNFSRSHPLLRPDTGNIKGNHGDQAYPLKGYYSDILNSPLPATHAQGAQHTEEQTPAEKVGIVFGTRLAGPGYSSTRYNPTTPSPESTWRRVNGVAIPPRPDEPDNCCMSGCVHCVWDDYRDEVESWAARVQEAQNRQPQMGKKRSQSLLGRDMKQQSVGSRREVASASLSMDDDGGGSETNWDPGDDLDLGGDLFGGIPVGIREFMKTEKKLKEKHLRRQGHA